MKGGWPLHFYLLLSLLICFLKTVAQQSAFHSPATKDSIIAVASTRYRPQSFLRNFFMGRNYRKVWEQPVTVPVFQLSTSGFTIKELGGGKQTKSLHLTDSAGKEWALRSVYKEVEEAMPGWAKGTAAQGFMQDLISASFPYGASIAGELSIAAGISCARPKTFFVADDTAFGKFRPLFANTVCSLEERDAGFDHTISSKELLVKLRSNNKLVIDQRSLLKARLLDMLFADWDRHEGNWRWGEKDSMDRHYAVAIPRDRDWAFYQSHGLLPTLTKWVSLHFLTGFAPTALNFKKLNYKAWLFDKTFLNGLDLQDWKLIADEVVTALTDSTIGAAVQTLPKEIFRTYGQQFIQTLKSRRHGLQKNAINYYRFLSDEVIINGSDVAEHFIISTNGEALQVSVYATTQKMEKLYERRFWANETHSIIINGFGGDDVIEIAEGTKSKIKLTLNGGSGSDHYQLQGNIKTTVCDAAADNNIIVNKSRAVIHLH